MKSPLLKKFSKTNYHNMLEKILDKKDFTANTKSLLLSMLYKLEAAYNDYKTVKVMVKNKDEFLKEIIETIEKKCVIIKLVEPSSEVGMRMLRNKEQAIVENDVELICLPTEKSLLVGITALMDNDFYVKSTYRVIDTAVRDFFFISYGLNIQECLFNFDGWSWNNQFDMEYQFLYTVLYYDFLELAGVEFIEEWKKGDSSTDHVEKFKKLLVRKYGENNAKRLVLLFYRLFLKILVRGYKQEVSEILEEGEKIKEALDYMDNKPKFIQDIYDKKAEINKRIKEIEQMMLDKKTLKQNYEKVNETLPLDKQIFSVRNFLSIIKQEREVLYNEIKNYNLKLDPKKYLSEKQELQKRYLKFSDILKIEKSKTSLKTDVIQIQSKIFEVKEMDIARLENKKDILTNIYVMRYYKNLKLNEKTYLKDEPLLRKSLKSYERHLLSKACKNNVFITLCKNPLQNIELLSEILDTRIINLEDIEVLPHVENSRIILDIYDGDVMDVSLKLNENIQELNLRPNKRVKIFN